MNFEDFEGWEALIQRTLSLIIELGYASRELNQFNQHGTLEDQLRHHLFSTLYPELFHPGSNNLNQRRDEGHFTLNTSGKIENQRVDFNFLFTHQHSNKIIHIGVALQRPGPPLIFLPVDNPQKVVSPLAFVTWDTPDTVQRMNRNKPCHEMRRVPNKGIGKHLPINIF